MYAGRPNHPYSQSGRPKPSNEENNMIRTEARRLLTLAGFAAADKLGYADRTGLRRKPRKTAGVPQCLGLLWLACASAAMGVASAQTQTSWPKGVYPTAPSYAAVARDSVCNFETMGGGTRMPTVCTQENLPRRWRSDLSRIPRHRIPEPRADRDSHRHASHSTVRVWGTVCTHDDPDRIL